MRQLRAIVVGAILPVLALAGCGGGGSAKLSTGSIAVVRNEQVTRAQFDAVLNQEKRVFSSQRRSFPTAGSQAYSQLQNQIVGFLVQRAEFDVKAQDLGVSPSEKQINGRLNQIIKQFYGGSHSRYEKDITSKGLTDALVHDDIKTQLVSEAIYKKVTASAVVNDADIKAYYASHAQQYTRPETRDVRHILVKTKALAETIYTKLRAGASFAALARKYSLDQASRFQGGKLTISKGQTVAQFDQTAFLLPKGAISRPVHTQFGWHIIQPLSDIQPAQVTPFNQLKATIRQQLVQQKKTNAMTAWVNKTKQEFAGKVKYSAGFAPPPPTATSTGATSTGP